MFVYRERFCVESSYGRPGSGVVVLLGGRWVKTSRARTTLPTCSVHPCNPFGPFVAQVFKFCVHSSLHPSLLSRLVVQIMLVFTHYIPTRTNIYYGTAEEFPARSSHPFLSLARSSFSSNWIRGSIYAENATMEHSRSRRVLPYIVASMFLTASQPLDAIKSFSLVSLFGERNINTRYATCDYHYIP
jgi:hypothetical protein